MATNEPLPLQAQSYEWNDAEPPPAETLNLWNEVGNGIDKSQTVVWKSAVESLEQAQKFLLTSEDARAFVEKYMGPIIGILVEQQPSKIGPHERTCVQDSLQLSVALVALDLDIQIKRKGECVVLDVLSIVFNKKKAYYKGNKANWNVGHMVGLPEVRLKMIERFRAERGFELLNRYMVDRINTPLFPKLDSLHQILQAIGDAIPPRIPGTDHGPAVKQMEDDAIAVSKAVMEFIRQANDDTLKKIPTEQLTTVVHQLRKIFDRLVSSRRKSTYDFFEFWRGLIFKLITSQSLPLKLFGWEQMNIIIEASTEHAPPPRSFTVSSAGCTFVNGEYVFAGEVTEDGYNVRGAEISYERRIPEGEEGAGKKLTLFRCTMRSQQKWWFLSEADEEQPGTDRDIDYYQHKSKEHEETEPPPSGWVTCRNAGVDPPPQLQSHGLLVPAGEENNTLEHQLAKWAIENAIIEKVLGDSVHREVVARSTALIRFLASMCEKYKSATPEGSKHNEYCLRTSHLLLAWKTCTRKADAAVSAQVYQLLVSILPSCPSTLAIPLLKAVQTSLHERDEKRDYLNEVAEFCSALAAASSAADNKNGQGFVLNDDVRAEVLKLLWAVLTHPDASTLKCYENLKRYVTSELRIEPKGREHREGFLKSCIQALSAGAEKRKGVALDEVQALRMVKLTRFVLEACPRDQAHSMVTDNSAALPSLLFNELTAFLERQRNDNVGESFRKVRLVPVLSGKVEAASNGVELIPVLANSSQAPTDGNAALALSERLRILRYVYGLSDIIVMSSPQLHALWNLCNSPKDREELMVFIANASSTNGNAMTPDNAVLPANNQNLSARQEGEALSAAFTDEVCSEVFLNLFCAPDLQYDELGEGAYSSFQRMFTRVGAATNAASSGPAIDALWRICLTAGNGTVASRAMKDLLSVYMSFTPPDPNNAWAQRQHQQSGASMVMEDNHVNFGERIFSCLTDVKKSLEENQPGAGRSAERCLRILNAAIGQAGGTVGSSTTYSTLTRLTALPLDTNLESVNKVVPHGMRGQSSFRRIGIMAKRQLLHNQSGQAYVSREDGMQGPINPNQTKNSTTLRFSIDVHPLETLASVKGKVAAYCHCNVTAVKPISVSGRIGSNANRGNGNETSQMNLNVVPDDSVVDEMGIIQGSELVFQIVERPLSTGASTANKNKYSRNCDLSDIFFDDDGRFVDKLFLTLLGVLEALPYKEAESAMSTDTTEPEHDAHKLVWDLLLAMPTNANIASRVRSTIAASDSNVSDDDAMDVDSPREQWSQLLDFHGFQRSVYVLLAIDALLQPAVEVLSILPSEQRIILERSMQDDCVAFRRSFIESGGFDAVVHFFSEAATQATLDQSQKRLGNAVALRVLKCCLFGNGRLSRITDDNAASSTPDEMGSRLLQSLSDADGLLRSLTSMVVGDSGISTSTISDVLQFLRLLFREQRTAQSFVALPDGTAEQFLITLLMWEGGPEKLKMSSSIGAALKIRKNSHDLILQTPLIADHALPWLIRAIDRIEVSSECTIEYFDVLQRLVGDDSGTARSRRASEHELRELGITVCKKISSCPRPTNENALLDFSTGVLCGCLTLLRALIETGGGAVLQEGASLLVKEVGVSRWSEMVKSSGSDGMPAAISSSLGSGSGLRPEDAALIDLMGAIFDGFLSPGGSTSVVAICCDKDSRQRGFDVVGAAARQCKGGEGYLALVARINQLIEAAAPFVRHKWGQVGGASENHNRGGRNTSKYSGLRNQGCTCYMNSFLQQMFMMPDMRKSMCEAPMPSTLRSTGGVISAKGQELVGKKVSMQWESGVSYDAIVEAFDTKTGLHTIRYCIMPVATVQGAPQEQQIQAEEIARLPPPLPDEFFLSEGRPGKETGVFEIVNETATTAGEEMSEVEMTQAPKGEGITETDDEKDSRHLLEELQRTFIHLDEGSRGRCFDPRALVEASACLKLEFDVWQQNDASEFATKFLDRLEIVLKRWAPSHFEYLDHTFGLKTTKQKICKECGLKTNREEKLLNIDCQIRGKSDIHEALDTMTEVEIMEGNNKVFCDRCKRNTDTVLRTAISMLPNMLILSLKRFDLDYNTFETVKLNSRCAFGQTLNLKKYSLEALEAMEEAGNDSQDGSSMDTSNGGGMVDDPLSKIPDEDYEYRLAGVLVHAGVAQGGHYYSFIKDRKQDQWYRFDDEDVTPFDPAAIENECFGGKVKKETKWPNGQVHTVESEQYANALMLFYEKVKPNDVPVPIPGKEKSELQKKHKLKPYDISSGYDIFEPDVRKSNATHRWQTFLFDTEFQLFLKGLLGLCRLSNTDNGGNGSSLEPVVSSSEGTWRASVIQMLLNFVFDIMLYASDRPYLNDWVNMTEELFGIDSYSATLFAHKLAKKTEEVSPNWLRTFLLECPDQAARHAAVRIFSAAVHACVTSENEQKALTNWMHAWKDELSSFGQGDPTTLPCALGEKWRHLESPAAFGSGASCVGRMISFINILLEALHRQWRYSSELGVFIRNLGTIDSEKGGRCVRKAMLQAMIPARLIAIITRDRSPRPMRKAFPGAACSAETAETQIRTETNPVAHVLPLGGNHMMNPTDVSSRSNSPMPSDFLSLFEAIGCLASIRGVAQAPLVAESDETTRGRPRVALSKPAINALTIVFQESCAPNAVGMGQREIEAYLHRCGVDSASVPTQKIVDIMAKYPTTSGNGTKGNFLSLEGFLAYYRDTAQSSESRVRADLHTFGFRPDLTRRSRDSRVIANSDNVEQPRNPTESVAVDAAAILKNHGPINAGPLAEYGLESFQFFSFGYNANESMAEHLFAGLLYGRDNTKTIVCTLKTIYHAPAGWGGNETLGAAIMVLKIIASLPGESQDKRIAFMMQCPESPALNIDHGSGLLMAAHAFHTARPNQPYSSEINYAFDRYVYVLKELLHLTPIVKWLQDNRQIWLFMERELLESQHHGTSANGQARGTYSGREVDATSVPLDHHHSDSDMAGINDSDDEDDDSRFEDIGTLHEAPQEIVVEGAGAAVVNGLYYKDGYFENACKYSMQGKYQGKPCTFSLFQCNVSNNTKHWYISIVPRNSQPGTSTDIDFYSAPVLDNCLEYPPQNTWTKSNEGRDPPPRLNFKESASPRQLDPQDPMISPRHPGSGLDDANHGTQPYI